eukprot:TRINITY_DN7449_c0_g1_i2.p1 TRINITY_DN7449_c0_g1~~TRINITY_DN7449_c0_g1_i2.p1  ORF type:complete len:395 (-),score=71.70 TRINITY_DN7449_c0_g1_i2:237-1421(-)
MGDTSPDPHGSPASAPLHPSDSWRHSGTPLAIADKLHIALFPTTPVHTTEMIQVVQRPGGLPAKSPEELRRHARLVAEMQKLAMQREEQEAKEAKRTAKRHEAKEAAIVANTKLWQELLPGFSIKRSTSKVEKLVLAGIPPKLRGQVWNIAVGNALNITLQDFESLTTPQHTSSQTARNVEALVDVDIPRTFGGLGFFAAEGPLRPPLKRVLICYALYRADIGYVQGMGFLVAMLLLFLDEAESFCTFSNMMLSPLLLAFFKMDQVMMARYTRAWHKLLKKHVRPVSRHLQKLSIQPDLYLLDWIMTVFSKSLPLDTAAVIWDGFTVLGDAFIFRSALGVMKVLETELLRGDFDACVRLLQQLPAITAHRMSAKIADIDLTAADLNKVLARIKP